MPTDLRLPFLETGNYKNSYRKSKILLDDIDCIKMRKIKKFVWKVNNAKILAILLTRSVIKKMSQGTLLQPQCFTAGLHWTQERWDRGKKHHVSRSSSVRGEGHILRRHTWTQELESSKTSICFIKEQADALCMTHTHALKWHQLTFPPEEAMPGLPSLLTLQLTSLLAPVSTWLHNESDKGMHPGQNLLLF